MNKTIRRHRKRQRKRQRGGSDSEWEMIEQPDELEMKIVNMTKGLPPRDRYELMDEFNKHSFNQIHISLYTNFIKSVHFCWI